MKWEEERSAGKSRATALAARHSFFNQSSHVDGATLGEVMREIFEREEVVHRSQNDLGSHSHIYLSFSDREVREHAEKTANHQLDFSRERYVTCPSFGFQRIRSHSHTHTHTHTSHTHTHTAV